jgi:uncharacterized protein YycO
MNIIKGLIKLLGKIKSPWSEKYVCSEDHDEISLKIAPGDTLLSTTFGQFSNIFIPGPFKHAAIYLGDELVIEAVGTGVRVISLADFVFKKDRVAVLRPNFMSAFLAEAAAQYLSNFAGVEYDYLFTPGVERFYCSELVQFGYEHIMGEDIAFTKRNNTVLPSDFFYAKEKFVLISLISKKEIAR